MLANSPPKFLPSIKRGEDTASTDPIYCEFLFFAAKIGTLGEARPIPTRLNKIHLRCSANICGQNLPTSAFSGCLPLPLVVSFGYTESTFDYASGLCGKTVIRSHSSCSFSNVWKSPTVLAQSGVPFRRQPAAELRRHHPARNQRVLQNIF